MIILYLATGISAGLIAAAVAALSGASLLLVCGVYVVTGSVVVALLAGGRIVLNAFTVVPAPEPAHIPSERAAPTAMRILAVDDDPFILELIESIASDAGVTDVAWAQSGEQALRLLADPNLTFDYFLFDIRMPGIDGVELCRRVRQMSRYRDTPISMLTSVRDVAHMNETFRAGATDYAMKPIDVADLNLRLRRAQDVHLAAVDLEPRKSADGKSLQLITASFERLGSLWRDRRDHLVERVALSNYLTQVPQKCLADVSVFAVIITRTAAPHAAVPQEADDAALYDDIAAAVVASLGPDLAIMTYTRDADLLIVTHCAHPLRALSLEMDITRRLSDSASAQSAGKGLTISVGGPVQLQGKKENRATFATDRALMLAEDRITDQQGRSLAAQRKA